jgi:hypothetical protein
MNEFVRFATLCLLGFATVVVCQIDSTASTAPSQHTVELPVSTYNLERSADEDIEGADLQSRRKLPTLSHMAQHGKHANGKKGGGGGGKGAAGKKRGGGGSERRDNSSDGEEGDEDESSANFEDESGSSSSSSLKPPPPPPPLVAVPDSSPSYSGTCPASNPVSGKLKVVSRNA